MTTYLALDIQPGPGLDQQAYDAVVATKCGHNERRVAKLHHEWTWRGRARWLSGVDPVCPPPLTTYLVLDIQVGPCLDQQVYDAVVALISVGHHERRVAMLHHEWTCRGSKELGSTPVRGECQIPG